MRACTTSPRGSLPRSTTVITWIYLFFHVNPNRPPATPRLVVHTRHHRPRHAHPSQPLSQLRRLCHALQCIIGGMHPLVGPSMLLRPTHTASIVVEAPAAGAAPAPPPAGDVPSSSTDPALQLGNDHASISNHIHF
jgi:hypothetical protein